MMNHHLNHQAAHGVKNSQNKTEMKHKQGEGKGKGKEEDEEDMDVEELTPLGVHLSLLPVDPRIGKLMLFGSVFQCIDPILTIAASLSFRSPFYAPVDSRDQADKVKRSVIPEQSDHLTLLRAYDGWLQAKANGGLVFFELSLSLSLVWYVCSSEVDIYICIYIALSLCVCLIIFSLSCIFS